MCGICGAWGAVTREAIEAMVAAMHHRGPDDRGVYCGPTAGLGMARLSILDLSPAGHQPMSTLDGELWIVYNGETYNFREERAALEAAGHTFTSTSDTEVVLRMYAHYGDDFLRRLRGMFALAIYDLRGGPGRERLLLARDQLGIKPLLIARAGSRLLFASEMKALLASGLLTPEIDPEALRLLLTYGAVIQPRTMLRGVEMLPPAHRLIVDAQGARMERYWSLGLNRAAGLRGQPYEEQVAGLAAALEESVRLQLVSDVPLGAFLSGGVDSSLLVALMARAAGHQVKTFSVGFTAEGADIDESEDARRTARFLGTDHHAVLIEGEEVRRRIEHIAGALDQPTVDGVNSYFVSYAARQAVTVAISGTGGDELFAGYPWFIRMALYQMRCDKAPWLDVARAMLAALARQRLFDPLMRTGMSGKLLTARNCAGFTTRFAANHHIFTVPETARLLAPGLRAAAHAGQATRYDQQGIDELPHGSPLERVSALCLRGYTVNQLLRDIDAVSMAHSLEVRVPYLDPVVTDFALSLPDSAKLGDLTHLERPEKGTYRETGAKRILVDAGKALLPPNFDQQPKRGFAMPFAAWLRGPLREVLQDTLSPRQVVARGLLDPAQVTALTTRFFDGQTSWAQPWLLMMLELWYREVLEKPPVAAATAGRAG